MGNLSADGGNRSFQVPDPRFPSEITYYFQYRQIGKGNVPLLQAIGGQLFSDQILQGDIQLLILQIAVQPITSSLSRRGLGMECNVFAVVMNITWERS